MILRPIRTLCALLALLLAGVAPASAQGVGSIGGKAIDASGAVLPGVSVTLTVQGNIAVNADQVSRADFKLEIGALEEAITVSGQHPPVSVDARSRRPAHAAAMTSINRGRGGGPPGIGGPKPPQRTKTPPSTV